MGIQKKILLSIPSIISIVYFFTYILFPKNYSLSMNDYYLITISINILIIIQIIIIMKIISSYKNIESEKKWIWLIILIVFQAIGSLFFIWNRNEKLKLENENKHL